jgi:hypothetical protein
MLHYRREIDVEAIIAAVLKVRALERTNPAVSATDFVISLAEAYRDWTGEFIDTIADYAERDRETLAIESANESSAFQGKIAGATKKPPSGGW